MLGTLPMLVDLEKKSKRLIEPAGGGQVFGAYHD